ncbi:transmembrane protein 255B [Hylobates moloch]|uniref:transmembrane protein 255B n=1 Tax=Hylobates moloch TaxID=81572 RepID=UPI00136369AE|nr:transmembrane protein 255B [Hylobates moloch]
MQPPVPGPPGLLDPAEGLSRRKRTSLWFVGSLLLVSVLIVTVGLAATTRTENVTVGGYYPGIILGFGSFLGIIGINLVENRRQMLVAAIVFISFGVVAAFCCAIVDGVFAAQHIVPLSQLAYGPAVPPQTLYNPAQQILAYAGFRPTPEPVPTCSSYPLPLQPCSRFPVAPSSALASSENLQPPSPSSSGCGLPGQAPPRYAPTYFPPGEKPPPYAP